MIAQTIKRQIELSEPQSEVLASRASIIAEIAGQGGGKTGTLSWSVGQLVTLLPEVKGFIGANTNMQLQQSTMTGVLGTLKRDFGMTQYDKHTNPKGHFVIDRAPPSHWKRSIHEFNKFNGIMSFWNGQRTFLGSLENYSAHDGKQFGWAHLDETKDTKKEALTTVILARLRQYGLWTDGEKMLWAPNITAEIAERQGLKAWNPCYIHTSPSEGNVDWLIDLLGIAPYEKQIKDAILKKDDYFFKNIVVVDPDDKTQKTETTVVIYSTYHNEHNLPPGHIAKMKSRLSAAEILKFIYGYPFGKNGGEFFPGFNRLKHVKKVSYDKTKAIASTWDFNATPYITCLLAHVSYITRYWNEVEKKKYDEPGEGRRPMEVLRFSFFKEYTVPDSTTEGTADMVYDDYGQFNPDIFVNGDASGRSRIEGLGTTTQYHLIANRWKDKFYLRDGWLRTGKTNIGNGKRRDLMNRILEDKIPEVELEFDESMVTTIRDFEYLLKGADGAKHKELEKDKNGIKVQKLGHCFIGETMIATKDGEKRIDEVKIGDFVMTRAGFRKVLAVHDNGIKPVVKYNIGNISITCTKDHMFFANGVFAKIENLINWNTFCIFEKNKICNQRLLVTPGITSVDTQNQKELQTAFIIRDGLRSTGVERKSDCTFTSGYANAGQYLKDMIFTILIATRSIMKSVILSAKNQQSISGITLHNQAMKLRLQGLKDYLKRQSRHLSTGMEAMTELNGIGNMQKGLLKKTHSLGIALSAERNMKDLHFVKSNSVQTSARIKQHQEGAGLPRKTLFKEPVLFAEQNSASTSMQVGSSAIGTATINMQRVYDLTVEEHHEYFANGILVHNCGDAVEYLVCDICKDFLKE
jgi:hypothetical protein